MAKSKDPARQWQGLVNRSVGATFEAKLNATFAYYADKGYAKVEKTPEPVRIVKRFDDGPYKGKFLSVFAAKAQADYEGTLKGGRALCFEAKFTSTEKMEQSRVTEHQTAYLSAHAALGARCFVIVGFSSGSVYLIPWDVWVNMKERFGRKYLKETDLEQFKLQQSWNGVLLIFK